MDFSARLKAANTRLKNGKIRLRIEQSGGRLCLRGTLPSRDGGEPFQQRIYLGVTSTNAGLSSAETKAKECHVHLEQGRFVWDEWLQTKKSGDSCQEWIDRMEKDYFDRRERNPKSETTWSQSYAPALRRLPPDQPLTAEILVGVLLTTEPDSHSRKTYCMALTALSKFAELEVDLTRFRGSYQFGDARDRIVPSDDEILAAFTKIKTPGWKWVYGMLATYGLRPHEVFLSELEGNICVVTDGKTGFRKVWPFPSEWHDLFYLADKHLPKFSGRNNREIGQKVSIAFKRYEVGFTPYALRHAWAIRTLEIGLDISLAAQQMGHSLAIHSKTYHKWISEKHHQAAYDRLLGR